MSPPKRPPTIAQAVAATIREQILSREIAGGEPLRQDAIAKAFGSSIIPVREALRQLEAEGLVELHARRGAVATKLTLDKALEWIHLRRLIETDMISRAIGKITEADLAKAEQVLTRFEDAMDNYRDVENWSAINWEFHSTLYAPLNRPETMKVLATLHANCDRYVRLQLLTGDHIERAEAEHRELLELCRRRDKRGAKALMQKHTDGLVDDLKEVLGS
ncbi:MAG: GntR family transcriptional regulator [Congregibacter sp.]